MGLCLLLDKVQIGIESEYKAICWLLGQGYTVARNVAHTGIFDLVAYKEGKTLLIDVKTLQFNAEGPFFGWKSYLSEEQIAAGIRPLFVYGETVGWNRDYF